MKRGVLSWFQTPLNTDHWTFGSAYKILLYSFYISWFNYGGIKRNRVQDSILNLVCAGKSKLALRTCFCLRSCEFEHVLSVSVTVLTASWPVVLTQFCDAAHPGCEQRLLQRAELGLGVALTLAAPPRALLVPVQVQTLRQAQHACNTAQRERELEEAWGHKQEQKSSSFHLLTQISHTNFPFNYSERSWWAGWKPPHINFTLLPQSKH